MSVIAVYLSFGFTAVFYLFPVNSLICMCKSLYDLTVLCGKSQQEVGALMGGYANISLFFWISLSVHWNHFWSNMADRTFL